MNRVRRFVLNRHMAQRGAGAEIDRSDRVGPVLALAGKAFDQGRAAARAELDPESITPEMLGRSMQSAGIPDADLVIRSGGERRLSNFLLWQAAYAELVFTDKLWPDFGADDLEAALAEFSRRERRFGGVPSDRSRAAELADAQLRGMFGRMASKD